MITHLTMEDESYNWTSFVVFSVVTICTAIVFWVWANTVVITSSVFWTILRLHPTLNSVFCVGNGARNWNLGWMESYRKYCFRYTLFPAKFWSNFSSDFVKHKVHFHDRIDNSCRCLPESFTILEVNLVFLQLTESYWVMIKACNATLILPNPHSVCPHC